MHGTFRIGHFWSNIPSYETRGQCNRCQTTEDMSHILITCTTGTASQVWHLAQNAWPHAPEFWPNISLGIILAGGSIATPEEDETPQDDDESEDDQERAQKKSDKRGRDRLLQILISEAAHLIWVTRCERVINERSHAEEEIKTRWLKAINLRLTEDKIIATKIRRAKTSIKLVKSTWAKVLQRQGPIPWDWIHQREVLVGRRVHTP